ncbi:MAG: S8 family peptidase [Burkholderiales bacterium]|uniref:S8 family peptidase n=1 Tax=Limnobacter sp. TaxID=2003368 RepID=UPI00395531BD|nr:S8 family peptidase [Burkholderiales bacterium]
MAFKRTRLAASLGLFVTAGLTHAEPIHNQYIVVLKDTAVLAQVLDSPAGTPVKKLMDSAQAQLGLSNQQINFRYQNVFQGFAVNLPDHVARGLNRSGLVAYVEQDQTFRLNNEVTQNNATWGLDRLDTRENTRDMQYTYSSTGAKVHAYVVDSGLRASHVEFRGRVGNGFDATLGSSSGGLLGGGFLGGGLIGGGSGLFGGLFGSPSAPTSPPSGNPSDPLDPSSTPADCNGHGTHVAGTIGGTQFGVAKNVILHGVRVVNCAGTGTSSSTVAGIDWVLQNHVKPAVMNLSLGGGASSAVDQAIRSAHNAGIVTVVAAGNESRDACQYSPAREPLAITVASTDRSDKRSSFSNTGSCVDLFAPGSDITSAGISNDNAQQVFSGTSMASPHVAGAAAKLLSKGVLPENVATTLKNGATPGVVTDPRNTLNLMLYSR